MNRPFQHVTPDRLQIREGGGCISAFGLPFFGAGVFLFLTLVGIVPVSNADELPGWAWPFLVLMAIAFTAAGGVLVFGRSWTTIDGAQRQVIKQLGLLVPLRERVQSLDGYTSVTLGFLQGDSDTVDKFPIALTGPAGPDLTVCTPTDYAQARECAKTVAAHLQLEIEDATTDHPVRVTASQLDVPFRQRVRQEGTLRDDTIRPADARSHVTQEMGQVRIVIPPRPMRPLVLATTLIPTAILFAVVPSLATFFRHRTRRMPLAGSFSDSWFYSSASCRSARSAARF